MPGAGTDKTKNWIDTPGPIMILVEPQLGENIGAAARVMANFALKQLRLVKPRDGWPNIHARRAASGADRVLEEAQLYDSVEAAIADRARPRPGQARDLPGCGGRIARAACRRRRERRRAVRPRALRPRKPRGRAR